MKPNYIDCQKIVAACDNFYEKVETIDGTKISIFNYTVSIYEMFINPLQNETKELDAFELRGLTFVHTPNGVVRQRMLHKFLNVNEAPGYLYDDLKDWKVQRVQEKADGSMIRFIRLLNGRVIAKTKAGLGNDQSFLALQCYKENSSLKQFVDETLDNHLAAIFELTSPLNKIVCDYDKTELRLLQLREEDSGNYLDIYNNELVKKHNVTTTPSCEIMSLKTLIEMKKTVEGIEGWVVTITDGIKIMLVKIKTDWYMARHRLIDKTNSEDTLLGLILDDQLDDAIVLLAPDNPSRILSLDIQKHVQHIISQLTKDTMALLATFDGDRKKFAMANMNNPLFHYTAKFLGTPPDQEKIVTYIKNRIKFETRRLMLAREFLKKTGFTSIIKIATGDE